MLTKEEVFNKYIYYFERDLPIPYIPFKYRKEKNICVNIHPVKMKHINEFLYCVTALRLDEGEIASNCMSYSEYILYLNSKNNEFDEKDDKKDILFKFVKILNMCLKVDINIIKDKNNKDVFVLDTKKFGFKKVSELSENTYMVVNDNPIGNQITLEEVKKYIENKNYIGDKDIKVFDYIEVFNDIIELTNRDIDEIRQIINYQNVYNYDDTYMCDELKRDIEETRKLKSKYSNRFNAEKERMNLSIVLGQNYYTLDDYTIRRYYGFLNLVNNKETYLILKKAEMSGMVEIKNPPKHYLEEESDIPSNLVEAKGIRDKLK